MPGSAPDTLLESMGTALMHCALHLLFLPELFTNSNLRLDKLQILGSHNLLEFFSHHDVMRKEFPRYILCRVCNYVLM